MADARGQPRGPVRPVLLAGGTGTRLWPLSRRGAPKQVQPLLDGTSPLAATARRMPAAWAGRDPLVITVAEHRFQVAETLREAGITPAAILLEPAGRGTASALAAAAAWAGEAGDPVLAAVPSDHWVSDARAWQDAVTMAAATARAGWLTLIAATPSAAYTGYGYIRCGPAVAAGTGAYACAAFTEKPDATTAQRYLADGSYLWNTGAVVAQPSDIFAGLNAHAPRCAEAGRAAVAGRRRDLDFERLAAEPYDKAPATSFDRAVLEVSTATAVVPLAAGWRDLGSWDSLHEVGTGDAQANRLTGDVVARETAESYIHAQSRLVATLGVAGLAVVETADAVLVAARDRAEAVGELAESLAAAGRREALQPTQEGRPWGTRERLADGPGYCINRLALVPGGRIACQTHAQRSESWIAVTGSVRAEIDGAGCALAPGESVTAGPGDPHALTNPGSAAATVIEVQLGAALGDSDVARLEAPYGDTEG